MKNVYRDGKRSPTLTLKPYLREGETVLWTGTPYEKTSYRPPMVAVFGVLFWLCFVVAWMVIAARLGGLFALAGIPFLLVGGVMLWFLTFGIARRGKTTLYAVTETRALILYDTPHGTDCLEYAFSRLSGVMLRHVRNGSGTIELVSPESMVLQNMNYVAGRRARLAGGTFEMISNPERVYRLISARISGNVGKPDIPV